MTRTGAAIKRGFDVVAALAGLIVLSPLLAAIALAIRLDSAGPVFFRQERIGRGGVPFRIHKFRTMRVAPPDAGRAITVGADPRITRTGAVLRRHKLDELAQLVDVLQGTMSLVGPRPEVPRYVALYPPDLRAQVLSVRPGLTDLASIRFHDENRLLAGAADPERAYVDEVLPCKLALQAEYVRRASLVLDVRILVRTAWLLLGGR